jgi:hypothetical protein
MPSSCGWASATTSSLKGGLLRTESECIAGDETFRVFSAASAPKSELEGKIVPFISESSGMSSPAPLAVNGGL